MAVPVVASTSTPVSAASSGTDIAPNYPSGISAGDVLICIVASDQSTNTQQWNDGANKPSGFTFIGEAGNADSDCHVAAFYKEASGSESGSETVTAVSTSNGRIGFMMRLTGVDTADILNVLGTAYTTATDALAHTIGGATTDEDDCLAIVAYALDGGNGQTFALDGSWSAQQDETSDTNNFGEVSGGWGTLSVASQGAYSAVQVTSQQSNQMAGFTFAIKGEASGATVTGSGSPAADDADTAGTAEREVSGSGTPDAQAGATSGTGERELTSSGTPAAQDGATVGAAERVLTCSGTLLSAASSTAGTASLQLRLLLTAAEGRELRDEDGALVSSLAGIIYEWYDKDTDTEGNPDASGTFNTDANGEATIQLPGTGLTAGQYGLLVLVHPSDDTIRGVYRIPVS